MTTVSHAGSLTPHDDCRLGSSNMEGKRFVTSAALYLDHFGIRDTRFATIVGSTDTYHFDVLSCIGSAAKAKSFKSKAGGGRSPRSHADLSSSTSWTSRLPMGSLIERSTISMKRTGAANDACVRAGKPHTITSGEGCQQTGRRVPVTKEVKYSNTAMV
eukprot:CAMPEP_0170732954 /NCGR_PEP_ID=MMETSP0437-20130122/1823_1 /TAXON_ID=0 /ORGANISM="Sexangularia sp." /LENGTH=158 /DNA_ID=CAMNT_0011071217 /DNA_START=590 /DNA_END=1066 /DNA_ORIENTATION=+